MGSGPGQPPVPSTGKPFARRARTAGASAMAERVGLSGTESYSYRDEIPSHRGGLTLNTLMRNGFHETLRDRNRGRFRNAGVAYAPLITKIIH
jgi:hypothetical protein